LHVPGLPTSNLLAQFLRSHCIPKHVLNDHDSLLYILIDRLIDE